MSCRTSDMWYFIQPSHHTVHCCSCTTSVEFLWFFLSNICVVTYSEKLCRVPVTFSLWHRGSSSPQAAHPWGWSNQGPFQSKTHVLLQMGYLASGLPQATEIVHNKSCLFEHVKSHGSHHNAPPWLQIVGPTVVHFLYSQIFSILLAGLYLSPQAFAPPFLFPLIYLMLASCLQSALKTITKLAFLLKHIPWVDILHITDVFR